MYDNKRRRPQHRTVKQWMKWRFLTTQRNGDVTTSSLIKCNYTNVVISLLLTFNLGYYSRIMLKYTYMKSQWRQAQPMRINKCHNTVA
jgi:hypothetical protein